MAFSAGNTNGVGARTRGRRSVAVGTLSEMNVVPLVDVVLVLLIIFMVTAQAMQSGLQIEVPQVKDVKETVEDLPIVELSKTGNIYLNDKLINLNELAPEISKRFPNQKSVYLRADKRGLIAVRSVQVVDVLGKAHLVPNVVVQEVELPKK